ncbi:MAG TPA: mycofactocin biosynthesis peptidyl-dipeptidase MftE [Acidimicrobiales bacterium]|nr:mycofactocin biosynthesis peptidyl-dipeptidase MftE [Acidimicrobiales bacterium]
MSTPDAPATRRPRAGPVKARPLAEMTWPAAAELSDALLVVPLGATEQHGPHLPLGTDTLVAAAVCRELAGRERAGRELAGKSSRVTVAPALPYGSSGEHAGFPGTLSIGQDALETIVVELVRSADRWAGTVLVSGHGGNAEPLTRAVETSTADGRRALAWWPVADVLTGILDSERWSADAHAGRVETSLLLHLAPALVGGPPSPCRGVRPAPLSEIGAALRAHGVAPVSPTGVLGDPAGASAAEGAAILAAYVADLESRIARWQGTWA